MKPLLILFLFTGFLWVLSIWAVGLLATIIGLVTAWIVVICLEWKHLKCCDE